MTLKINKTFTKSSKKNLEIKKKRIKAKIPLYQRTTLRFFKPSVKIKGRKERR